MSIKSVLISVEPCEGVIVRNQLLYHEPASDRLVVMLPGRNYSCDRPVLHYIRIMSLQHGFDVLSLQYGFQVAGGAPKYEDMLGEVTRTSAAVATRGYSEICFVGKSLGSPLALALARSAQISKVSVTLLTPIPEALQPTDGIRALAVIGTADPVFAMPEYKESRQRGDMEWLVLDGLHHGLEVEGSWTNSMAALKQIVATCERFLTCDAPHKSSP
ncbi:MAG: hypothetical protein AB1700_03255 [Bacillota bacterium]